MLKEILDFISWAIVCGFSLGVLAVVLLAALRKGTPQRTKWAVLGSTFGTLGICLTIYVYFAISPTQEDQIRQSFQAIPDLGQAEQWYEHTYANSSATGKCGNTTTHRWFGLNTKIENQAIVDWYDQQLDEDGWHLEGTGWKKNTSQGIFTFDLDIFENPSMIDSGQVYYTIPSEALQKTLTYQSVYVLKLNLISQGSLDRCFSP